MRGRVREDTERSEAFGEGREAGFQGGGRADLFADIFDVEDGDEGGGEVGS